MLSRFRRPSPAIVIAVAACVVATSGVAIGSIVGKDGKITACYAKRDGRLRLIEAGASCRKSERRIAWNQRGRPGPAGEDGEDGFDGFDGFDGEDGVDGRDGATMLIGSFRASLPAGGVAFAFPSGRDVSSGTESEHAMLSPAAETVARDLAVKLDDTAPDPGVAKFTFTIRVDRKPTSVSCSMTGTEHSCTSGSDTAPIPPGSELTIEYAQTGTATGDRDFRFGWRAATP